MIIYASDQGPLPRMGLTGQELSLYYALLEGGSLTGYEAARETGISRANAYHSLASLLSKGFAYATEEEVPRYSAIEPEEAVALARARFEAEAALFASGAPERRGETAPFLTVRGRERVMERLRAIVAGAEDRVYIACPRGALEGARAELEECAGRIKLVLILERAAGLKGAVEHIRRGGGQRLRLIADGKRVLTGELAEGGASCVYSENPELVALIKESLTNEIELIRRQR